MSRNWTRTTQDRNSWTFEPIQGMRTHERVVDQVVFAIRSGVFQVGERLPSIERLSGDFEVSKPTVGEAIKVLADCGVVESRRGVNGGVTVLDDNIPVTLLGGTGPMQDSGMRELVEARRPIETQIAILAAERMGRHDERMMADSIERLRQLVDGDFNLRLHYDHLFHYAMGRAARSDLLAYYQHQVLKRLVVVAQDYFSNEEDPEMVIDLHERTQKAMRGGNRKEIEAAMDAHLRPLEASATGRSVGST